MDMRGKRAVASATVLSALLMLVAAAACRGASERSGGRAAGTTPAVASNAGVESVAGSTDAGEAAATVLISGMRFLPEATRVKAGQSVAWVFNDPGVMHSVTAFNGSFDSGLKSSGAYVVTFDTSGTYCYQCLPHPGENRCDRGSEMRAGSAVLYAEPIRSLTGLLNRGGGGHMQGMVVVEP